jgi:glycosyltransferase involved in cell wall biosynthesis
MEGEELLAHWFKRVCRGDYGFGEGFNHLVETYRALLEGRPSLLPLSPAPCEDELKAHLAERGGLTIAVVSYHTNPLYAIRERVREEEGIEIDLYDQGGQGTYQERLAYELASRFGVNVLSFTLKRSYLTKERYLNIHPLAPVIPIPNRSGRFVEDDTGLVKKENLYFIIDELVDATLDYLAKNRINVDVFSGHYATGVAACRRLHRKYEEAGGRAIFSATTHSLGWDKFVNVAGELTAEELTALNLNRRLAEEKEGFHEADLVITVSPTEAETVTHPSLYAVPREKVVVIPGGVDTDLFRPYDPALDKERVEVLRREHRLSDERVILMTGRLWDYKRKGVDTCIEVCAGVKREVGGRLGLKFAFVGLPPEGSKTEQEIEALVRRWNIWDESIMMEMVPHERIPAWLQLAAQSKGVVLALPRVEPWGLANLEAMATGNVVVTINRGGPPHYIVDGRTGILVDREDVQGVVRRVVEVLLDDDLARRIREEAARVAAEEFSWSAVAGRFLWAHLLITASAGIPGFSLCSELGSLTSTAKTMLTLSSFV